MRLNRFTLFIVFLLLISFLKLYFGYPYHHEDADQFYYWGKYLAENGFDNFYKIDVPNATRANYPPIINYVLFGTRKIYLFVHDFVWYFHLRIPFYYFRRNTSLFIPWFETKLAAVTFNKIPGVVADLINALIIYRMVMLTSKGKKEKLALILGLIFILSPAVWYSTSVWGQLDSIYILFILLSLKFLLKEKYFLSMTLLLLSILTKPIAIYIAPVFGLVYLKKTNWKIWLKTGLFSLVMILLLYYPFDPGENCRWIWQNFIGSLGGPLNQMVNNAFNFWVLPLGFDNYPHTYLFAGWPLYKWGYLFYALGVIVLTSLYLRIKKRINNQNIILLGFLFSILAFLVLPKVHERYFYPALIFSLLLGQFGRDWLIIYFFLSTFHFFNLYHGWWMPRFEPLILFLSNIMIIKVMVVVEIVIFFYGMVKLAKEKV